MRKHKLHQTLALTLSAALVWIFGSAAEATTIVNSSFLVRPGLPRVMRPISDPAYYTEHAMVQRLAGFHNSPPAESIPRLFETLSAEDRRLLLDVGIEEIDPQMIRALVFKLRVLDAFLLDIGFRNLLGRLDLLGRIHRLFPSLKEARDLQQWWSNEIVIDPKLKFSNKIWKKWLTGVNNPSLLFQHLKDRLAEEKRLAEETPKSKEQYQRAAKTRAFNLLRRELFVWSHKPIRVPKKSRDPYLGALVGPLLLILFLNDIANAMDFVPMSLPTGAPALIAVLCTAFMLLSGLGYLVHQSHPIDKVFTVVRRHFDRTVLGARISDRGVPWDLLSRQTSRFQVTADETNLSEVTIRIAGNLDQKPSIKAHYLVYEPALATYDSRPQFTRVASYWKVTLSHPTGRPTPHDMLTLQVESGGERFTRTLGRVVRASDVKARIIVNDPPFGVPPISRALFGTSA